MNLRILFFTVSLLTISLLRAQSPKSYNAASVYHEIEKLSVFGRVLYIAAHPDDENTRLLAYLANERKYATAYLSLTRGDGGQNLIGDEQGVDLGLVRTQELLAARRVDGAEQFFTTAFDFGYSKSPEEALRIWDHEKVLSDVVWVIRQYKPDIIITRFPTTGEGGHGHHTASAILAGEAFDAAGDSTRFREQLQFVKPWKAKRLFWNTFNFGGNNTTREDQMKLDVGAYNAILGKSYGELAAESRSEHKSQGFGVPAQRGSSFEYFTLIKGEAAVSDIMEGVDINAPKSLGENYVQTASELKSGFNISKPGINSAQVQKLKTGSPNKNIDELFVNANGIFLEVTVPQQLNAIGDSMTVQFTINNRSSYLLSKAKVVFWGRTYTIDSIPFNKDKILRVKLIPAASKLTNPYFLDSSKQEGSYNVSNQLLRGKPESAPVSARFSFYINENEFLIDRTLLYKYTDPVKGELYEPMQIINPVLLSVGPRLVLIKNETKTGNTLLQAEMQANIPVKGLVQFYIVNGEKKTFIKDSLVNIEKGSSIKFSFQVANSLFAMNSKTVLGLQCRIPGYSEYFSYNLKKINYDHIPDIFYNYDDNSTVLKLDLKTAGKNIGYIEGAGDKVMDALKQMGYRVTLLSKQDVITKNLKNYDAIVTGVRAYNIHSWLSDAYPVLMKYVEDGGVLLNQYNTNNNLGTVKAKMGPYPFTISRNRITDETAAVTILQPLSKLLNWPNKITNADFENWIQERSTYEATALDAHYTTYLSMSDPGEKPMDGSIITTNYGKGKYVYCSLVMFRQLPAAVAGAFPIMANLLAPPTP